MKFFLVSVISFLVGVFATVDGTPGEQGSGQLYDTDDLPEINPSDAPTHDGLEPSPNPTDGHANHQDIDHVNHAYQSLLHEIVDALQTSGALAEEVEHAVSGIIHQAEEHKAELKLQFHHFVEEHCSNAASLLQSAKIAQSFVSILDSKAVTFPKKSLLSVLNMRGNTAKNGAADSPSFLQVSSRSKTLHMKITPIDVQPLLEKAKHSAEKFQSLQEKTKHDFFAVIDDLHKSSQKSGVLGESIGNAMVALSEGVADQLHLVSAIYHNSIQEHCVPK